MLYYRRIDDEFPLSGGVAFARGGGCGFGNQGLQGLVHDAFVPGLGLAVFVAVCVGEGAVAGVGCDLLEAGWGDRLEGS